MIPLLHHLFGDAAALDVPALGSLQTFLAAHAARTAEFDVSIDRAVLGGFASDRLGYAFAAGYGAALDALWRAAAQITKRTETPPSAGPQPTSAQVPRREIRVLCATEEGGAHPRAIRTTLSRDASGELRIDGRKRWSTLATDADELLVVTSMGADDTGRNRLRLVRVAARASGVVITPMPPPPFAPEIPHAEIVLQSVSVREDDVLPGDGYEAYLKPFRTLEDLHVHAALLGYLVGVGRRYRWPDATLEQLSALLVTVRALAASPVDRAETHLAVAGLLGMADVFLHETELLWERVGEDERARWVRDRALLAVAGKAREARRVRAWQRLREE
ncbi:acyl-CoA dehydrogenase family protein [Chondromyces crocatus]|uniref:Acyl-CoA dehydrogenase n=1 Tax=Chondromyces crocatus TaxID=52 RepID=A0A0K1EHJ9_CHOCO|nr:acyl-CoA dehydrogenase family protein [Chondromyces crocatus]AKT40351.1 acyl-CoA dehydrogenase [Chondromyces crocatus]